MTFNWEGRIWMEAWKDVKWVNLRVGQRETPAGLVWDGIMLNVTHSKQAEAEIRRSRAKLSALTAHVESVKEQERLNLAREVHDDLGGNLTAVKIGLSWLKRHLPPGEAGLLKRTAYLDDVGDQTIEATHRIASSLRPPVLDFGIVSAIDWQLKPFGQNTDIACELSAPDAAIPLGPEADITVFRIVQEALTNVARHAGTNEAQVRLWVNGNRIGLRVADQGRGFEATESLNRLSSGLVGMRERANLVGGEFLMESSPGRGTTLSVELC